MKAFTKLALVSAIAISSSAFALESADDVALSAVTGQDGINLTIALPDYVAGTSHGLTIGQVNMHDSNGFGALTDSGALQIGDGTVGNRIEMFCTDCTNGAGSQGILAIIDTSGGATGTTPTLNVAVYVPALTINVGKVYVADSNGTGSALDSQIEILDAMTLSLGTMNLNIQLGTEVQTLGSGLTTMIKLNTTISNGLTISGFKLNDNNGTTVGGNVLAGGSILVDTQTIKGAGDANLALVAGVDVTASGLVLTLDRLGTVGTVLSTTGGVDLTMTGVHLGTAANVGDTEIKNLNLNGTQLVVSGHN